MEGKMVNNVHPIIKRYIPIVRGIAGTFGSSCEVEVCWFNVTVNYA